MARSAESVDLLKCSFCGKSQKQVKKLIAGPGVYICDECIELCNEIVDEELGEFAAGVPLELPKPQEIFDFSVTSQKGYCDDGVNWGQAEMLCHGEGQSTPCSWVFRDAQGGRQAYRIPFVRVRACGR